MGKKNNIGRCVSHFMPHLLLLFARLLHVCLRILLVLTTSIEWGVWRLLCSSPSSSLHPSPVSQATCYASVRASPARMASEAGARPTDRPTQSGGRGAQSNALPMHILGRKGMERGKKREREGGRESSSTWPSSRPTLTTTWSKTGRTFSTMKVPKVCEAEGTSFWRPAF